MDKYKRENNQLKYRHGLQMKYFKDSSLIINMQTPVKLFFCGSAQMIMKNDLQPIIIFLEYQTKFEDKNI